MPLWTPAYKMLLQASFIGVGESVGTNADTDIITPNVTQNVTKNVGASSSDLLRVSALTPSHGMSHRMSQRMSEDA